MTDRQPNRDMKLTAVFSVIIFILLSTIPAKCGQVTGQIQSLGGQNLADSTITFSISQTAVPASQSVATTASPVTCGTDTLGNVVGITRPIVLPVASAGAAGTLTPSTTYYIQETYWNASGETQAGLELPFALGGAQNSITITAPLLQPASASGYKVYIQTASGSEKLQATITGWGNSTITTLLNVTAPPASNTSTCTFTFNDALIPTYTTYITDITDSTGTEVPGYPQNLYFQGSIVSLATMTPASGLAARFPQPIVSQPTNAITQSIRSPINLNAFGLTGIGSLNTSRRFVDQETGADMCAKLTACKNNLPSTGGICDATALNGAQSCAATVTCDKSNVLFQLGAVLLTGPASGQVFSLTSDYCAVWGIGKNQSYIILNNATGHGIDFQAEYGSARDLTIVTKNGITRSAGAAFHIGDPANPLGAPGAWTELAHVIGFRTFRGFHVEGGSLSNSYDLSASIAHDQAFPVGGGTPDAGFKVGPSTGGACCITSSNVFGFFANDDWADAGLVIDSGADSWNFFGLQQSCTVNSTNVHVKNSVGGGHSPTLIHFEGGSIEACGTGNSMIFDACIQCDVTGVQSISPAAAPAVNGLLINADNVKRFRFTGLLGNYTKECVKITGSSATDINISNTRIGDCAQQTNNTFDSIGVSANVGGLHFLGNTFAPVLVNMGLTPPANIPRNNIRIAAGTGDNIYITNNQWGNNSGTALSQGATGTGVRVSGNSGSGGANENTGPTQFTWQCTGVGTNGNATNGLGLTVQACNVNDTTHFFSTSSPGIFQNLRVLCFGAAGHAAGSGIFTFDVGGVGTALTCTVGTGQICSDTTHKVQVGTGSNIDLTVTSVVGETLADCSIIVEKW